jgi:integrase
MDFLQEQNLIMNGEYVCPELAQMYLDNPTGINHRVKSFLEGLDIQTTATVNNRSRAVSTKAAHALRHTFAYMAGVYNIPLAIVQSILGHMSPEMTEMYQRHASLKDKQKYLAQLPIALIGAAKAEPERQQLAELSKTLPIETIKNILKTLEV